MNSTNFEVFVWTSDFPNTFANTDFKMFVGEETIVD